MKTNHYKIFIACSDKLKEERNIFELAVANLNVKFHNTGKNTFLKPIMWEYIDPAVSGDRKQNDYNNDLKECDLLFLVFWGELGVFTNEEYKVAKELFKKNKKPRIYIFEKTNPIDFELNEENQKNLDVLRQNLGKKNSEEWTIKFENKRDLGINKNEGLESLELKIKETIENLFDYKEFPEFSYGSDKPFHESAGNEDIVSRSDALNSVKNIIENNRVLYVHGVSGSGKTKLVENLLYDISRENNIVWIDCAESTPIPEEIAYKLKKIINKESLSKEKMVELSETLSDNDWEQLILDDISNHIQTTSENDILNWFGGSSKIPKFIVFDDFDNLISEECVPHWLVSSFIEKCIKIEFAPKIIIIYKYEDDKIDYKKTKTREFLFKNSVNFKLNSSRVKNEFEIKYLDESEVLLLIDNQKNINYIENLTEVINLKKRWLPVQIQLLFDEFAKISKDQIYKIDVLKNIIKEYHLDDIELIKQLCDFLFQRIFDKPKPIGDALITLAYASSILQKYNSGNRAIDFEALKFMLKGDIEEQNIMSYLNELYEDKVFKKFHGEGDLNGITSRKSNNKFSYQHDTKLNYIYNLILDINDEKFNLNSKIKQNLHKRAAAFYENLYLLERNTIEKIKYAEFSIWNYSQIFGLEVITKDIEDKGQFYNNTKLRLERALPILNKIERELRTSFNFITLDSLRQNVVPGLNKKNQNPEETNFFIEGIEEKFGSKYNEMESANLVDLAEVHFQGLDKWSVAQNIALNVYNKLKEVADLKERHNSLDSFIQATHLAAILNFETVLDAEIFIKNFESESNKIFDDLRKKRKFKIYCIRLVERLLEHYLDIDYKRVYDGNSYDKNKIRDFKDKAIIANLCSSLGVFLNRSEKYADAISIYSFAINIYDEIRLEVGEIFQRRKLQYYKLVESSKNTEEKYFYEEEISYLETQENEWHSYIDKDLMCVRSNLSRTYLLNENVEKAIGYFNINLESWFGENANNRGLNQQKGFLSSQEYNYAVINISYYYFCRGEIVKAKEYWNLSKDIPNEEWLRLTKQQMKFVIDAYDKNEDLDSNLDTIANFKENSKAFEDIDPRAVLFSNFNSTALKIALILENLECYDTSEIIKVFDNLTEYRILSIKKEYHLAAKIITYTYNKFLGILKEKFLEYEYKELQPLEEWGDGDWIENEVLNHLNGIMTTDSKEVAFSPWRPPMIMAGILLMRSKPFSPSDFELNELKESKIKIYEFTE